MLGDGVLEVDVAAEAAEAALELDAFERRLAQVKQYKKQPKGDGGLNWSKDCARLQEILAAERQDSTSVTGGSALGTWSQFAQHVQDLNLSHCSLGSVDSKARMFSQLSTLNVSHNLLSVLDNLPASLQSLQAYDNIISAPPRCPLPSLLHLGLGHNTLTTLQGMAEAAPEVYSLDVSFNSISDVEELVPWITPEHLPNLTRLNVAGNPVALTHGCRTVIVQAAPNLQYLDGTDVTFSQRRAMRKRAAARQRAIEDTAEAAAREAVGSAAWAADMHLQGWVPPQAASSSTSASSTPRKAASRSTAASKKGKPVKGGKSPKGGKAAAEPPTPDKQPITWEAAMQHAQLSSIAQAATAEVFAQAAALEAESAEGILLGVHLHAVSGLPCAASIPGGELQEEEAAAGTPRKKGDKGGSAKGKGGKAGKSPRSASRADDEAPAQPVEQHRLRVQVTAPDGAVLRSGVGALGKDGVLAWGQLSELRHVLPVSVESRDALLFDGLHLEVWEDLVRIAPAVPQTPDDAAAPAGQPVEGGAGSEEDRAAGGSAPVQEQVLQSCCLAKGHLPTAALLGSTTTDHLYCGVDAAHWALESGAGSTQLQLVQLPAEAMAAVHRSAARQVAADMEEEAAAAAEAAGAAAGAAGGKGGKGGKKSSSASSKQAEEDPAAAAARQEEADARTAQLARTIAKEVLSSACVYAGVGASICVDGPPPSSAAPFPLASAVQSRQAALDAAAAEEQPDTARSGAGKKSGSRKK